MDYYSLREKIQKKPSKPKESYSFSVGVIMALESKLIKPREFKKLLEDPLPGILLFLKSRYPSLDEPINGSSLNKMILEVKSAYFNLLSRILPEPFILHLLFLPHDFHNLKANLKGLALKTPVDSLYHLNLGIISKGIMTNQVPIEYKSAFNKAYEAYLDSGSLQLAELILDREYISLSLQLASNSNSQIIYNYYKYYALSRNLITLLRGKRWNLPYNIVEQGLISGVENGKILKLIWDGKEDVEKHLNKIGVKGEIKEQKLSLPHIERALDEHLWKYLYGLRFKADISMDSIFIFSKLWDEELNFIKMVLLSRATGITSEKIKQRGLV